MNGVGLVLTSPRRSKNVDRSILTYLYFGKLYLSFYEMINSG
jgi:hypothetical protein